MRTPTYRNVRTPHTHRPRTFTTDTAGRTYAPIRGLADQMAADTMPGVDPETYPRVARAMAAARADETRKSRRQHRRMMRRMSHSSRPSFITRLAGWITLGVLVAGVSGLGAIEMGSYVDRIVHEDQSGITNPPEWHPTRTCPTEDSCMRIWTGNRYDWLPVVP